MFGWVIVALAVAERFPFGALLALAAAVIDIRLGIAVLAGVYAVARYGARPRWDYAGEARFLDQSADEVASGTTIRQAIRSWDGDFVDDRVRRLCDAGAPLSVVGEAVGSRMQVNGSTFAATCSIIERSGSPPAVTLRALAARAKEVAAFEQERRVATTQARFSATVVGVAPLVVTSIVIAMRGVSGDSSIATAAVAIGFILQVTGVAVVFRMTRGVR